MKISCPSGYSKYIIFTLCIFLCFIILSQEICFAQIDLPVITGTVYNNNEIEYGATLDLFVYSSKIDTRTSNEDGKFSFTLELHKFYTIEVSKEEFVTQKISITTKVPKEDINIGFMPIDIEVNMIEALPGLATSVLDKPIMKILYDTQKKAFVVDEKYQKEIDSELDVIKKQLSNLKQKEYNKLLREADIFFNVKKYEDAWLNYYKSLKYKPDEKYPKTRIKKIREIISSQKSFDKVYAKAIAKGDSYFSNNKELARTFYEKALLYKPREKYPRARVNEINKSLCNLLILKKQAYTNKITLADNLFNNKHYEYSKIYYEEAMEFFPSKQYPKERIKEINNIIVKDPGADDGSYVGRIDKEKKKYTEIITECLELLKEKQKKGDKNGEAKIRNKLGITYYKSGKYNKTLEEFNKTLNIYNELDNKKEVATLLNNIGIVYDNTYNYNRAIEYYNKSLDLKEKIGDTEGVGEVLSNIGNTYYKQENLEMSLEYYKKSLKIDEKLNNKKNIAASLNNIGVVYYDLSNYELAIENYQKSLKIIEGLGGKKEMAMSLNNLGNVNFDWSKYKKAIEYYEKSLKIKEDVNYNKGVVISLHNIGNVYSEMGKQNKAINYYLTSVELAEKISFKNALSKNYFVLSKVYSEIRDYENAYKYLSLYNSSLFSALTSGENRQMSEIQIKYEEETIKRDQEIEDLEKEIFKQNLLSKFERERTERDRELFKQQEKLNQLELSKNQQEVKRQETIRNFLIGGFILLLIFALYILKSYQQKRKDHRIIAEEKTKSDDLLLNILPSKVAADLKETGTTKPESYDNVTVFLSDIVGFTEKSSSLEPTFLISELNDIYTAFDDIMTRNYCERIKTIGDAYLAVCGMPVEDPKHAENIVRAALEIIKYLIWRNKHSKIKWEMRIGIHSGKVVGGVVGIKKYIYDVFGDSINTTARMESNSEPMKINTSDVTYNLLKDKFNFTERKTIEVEGKGKQKMYFVKSEII